MIRKIQTFFVRRQHRRIRFHLSADDLDVILESLERGNAPAALSRRVVARSQAMPGGVLDRALDLNRTDAQALLRSLHAAYRNISNEQGELVARRRQNDEVRPAIREAKGRANYLRCLHGLLSDQYHRQLPQRPSFGASAS